MICSESAHHTKTYLLLSVQYQMLSNIVAGLGPTKT